jgi:catechol 2,3-dioxygenase-like lactoylglutathione lyase family enzyme
MGEAIATSYRLCQEVGIVQNVYPTLRITDYDAARAFYVDTLGFQIDWEHRFEPGFPVFMHISRDGLALYLSQHRGAGPAGGLVYLYVPDVDAWYREFSAKGVRLIHPPEDQRWGTREMVLTDPDGNRLNISTRLRADTTVP